MVATSAPPTTGVLDPAGIETIPLEILNKIFSFACDDDCDLGLALSSKSMAMKLKEHPRVRILLRHLTREQIRAIFIEYFKDENAIARSILFPCLDSSTAGPVLSIRDLAKANWCTASLLGRMQITLIRRILKTYWNPLLLRDKHLPSAVSHEYFWAELDDFDNNPRTLRDEWLIESKVDAVSGCYPWSRVYVWPKQGRVLIRDQLLNTSTQYFVPLLREMPDLKQGSGND